MNSTVYRDAITIVMIAFVAMVIWVLPYLNPPTQEEKMDPPGSIVASIVWPEGNTDVDIWLDGPGEPLPVGYSNKGGLLWNLLRDDLGTNPDYTPLNFEHAFTRGIPPGEYRVNVQCYRCSTPPIPVTLEVSKKTGAEGPMQLIGSATITLNATKEEKTGLAFEINDAGEVVEGSINSIFSPLRSRRSK